MSQLTLLRRRTFGALLWTQFLGAFNDNLLKSALVVLVAYEGGSLWGLGAAQLVPLSGALFILPFFLFSASAGQLADRFRKSMLARRDRDHGHRRFFFRFVCWIVANCLYRLRTAGRENIPTEGPVLLVCNHVSFIDWMIVASACKRPPRFVMYHGYFRLPLIGWLFRDAKVIPIAPAREQVEVMEAAFDRIAAELEAGEVVCIFPEGALTANGQMNRFRPGVEKIVQRTPVPVVPMALVGMWGSFFSRAGGAAMRRPFRRLWSKIQLVIDAPVPAEEVTADALALRVAALGGLGQRTEMAARFDPHRRGS